VPTWRRTTRQEQKRTFPNFIEKKSTGPTKIPARLQGRCNRKTLPGLTKLKKCVFSERDCLNIRGKTLRNTALTFGVGGVKNVLL
jgi:hypothetical protein